MLIMFGSPTFSRKLVTNSSNLSWPTSMQSVCLMVFTRIFRSDSLAATSSGARGLAMRTSGALLEGTRRCISTLAAAEAAMGLAGLAAMRAPDSSGERVGIPRGTTLGSGITIVSPQEGQSISEPAPELSTANSCSHFGQLKMTSISGLYFGWQLQQQHRSNFRGSERKILFVCFLELLNARPDRRSLRCAVFNFCKKPLCFGGVFFRNQQTIIQFDPGFARVFDGAAESLEPITQACGTLRFSCFEAGFHLGRHPLKLFTDNNSSGRLLLLRFLFVF